MPEERDWSQVVDQLRRLEKRVAHVEERLDVEMLSLTEKIEGAIKRMDDHIQRQVTMERKLIHVTNLLAARAEKVDLSLLTAKHVDALRESVDELTRRMSGLKCMVCHPEAGGK